MLTMRPPISVHFKKTIDTVARDMEERIRGNYSLMSSFMRKEELLYLTASSPDIYFEQGGGTNILNEISSQNNQEFRLEVINNLVNRILVSNTENFTYHDSVYISSVLRKIGITDVNQFMKQISNMQTERKDTHKLIQLYEENKNYLTRILDQETAQKTTPESPEVVENVQKSTYYLHDDIYNRLETNKIYQEIKKYVQGSTWNENMVTSLEMNIAEQAALTQTFQLHNLRNEVLHKEEPLHYYHTNVYETIDENESEEVLSAKVSSAILTNLIDQLYFLRLEKITENKHSWFSIARSLFETADNTWKRYEWNHTDGNVYAEISQQNIEYLSEQKQEEIQILSEIENQYKTWNQQWNQRNTAYESAYLNENRFLTERVQNVTYGDSVSIENPELELQYLISQINEDNEANLGERTAEQIREQIRITNERNQENIRKIQELRMQAGQQPNLTELEQMFINENQFLMQNSEHITNRDSVSIEQEQLNLQYLISQINAENQVNGKELTVEEINEQLRVINERNLENYKKLQEIRTKQEQQPKLVDIKVDKKLAKKNSLRALEEPENIIREMFRSESNQIIQQNNMTEVIQQQEFFEKELQNVVEYLPQAEPLVPAEEDNVRGQILKEELITNVVTEVNHRTENFLKENSHIAEAIKNLETVVQKQRTEQILNALKQNVTTVLPEMVKETRHLDIQNTRELLSEELVHVITEKEKETGLVTEHILENVTLQHPKRSTSEHSSEEAPSPEKIYENNRMELRNRTEVLKEEMVHVIAEKEQEITSAKLEQIRKDITLQRPKTGTKEEYFRTVSLVHKEEEKLINEELLQNIRMQTQQTVREQTVEHRSINENKVIETNVQQTTQQITAQQMANMEAMVQQNVQKQIGQLSDKIYGKLEKKLQTERKRRGY